MRYAIRSLTSAFLCASLCSSATWAQSPSIWSGRTPIKPGSAPKDTVAPLSLSALLGTVLSPREIANLVDGVGQAVDDPGLYELAIRQIESLAGPRHPLAGYLHVRLASLFYRHGDRGRALQHALEGEGILREHLYLDLRELSEAEALRLARQRESALDLILTLATTEPTAAGRARCWDAFIRSRALVLDEMAARQRTVVTSRDTALARLGRTLTATRQRLAEESFREPDPNGRSRRALDRTRSSVDSLERELARRSDAFRERLARVHAGLDEVQRALQPDEALIAFAYYVEPPARPATLHSQSYRFLDRVEKAPRSVVMAFVLHPGDSAPDAFRLASATEVDSLVERWRGLVSHPAQTPEQERLRDSETRRVGDALRRRVWDPLVPALAGAHRVYVVLDGALQLVSLGALPADAASDTFLVERAPVLAYLGAERDLARRPPALGNTGRILAMGGIQFQGGAVVGPGGVAARPRLTACGEACTVEFPELPASEREAREAADIWCASRKFAGGTCEQRIAVGTAATKSLFKQESRGASVLHLSTHGFFLTCPESSTPTVSWRPSRTFDLAPPPNGAESPLLHSGLVFSVTRPDGRGTAAPESGLLTAEEVGSLDLSGARVVVLSACETGVGVVEAREGLLGLRRAFQVAGAGGLVVSLWPVGDESSRSYMRSLYEARFRRGVDLPTAARDASVLQLALLREEGRSTSPAEWAGFVVVGLE